MFHVLPNLYLSDRRSACNVWTLRAHNVVAVACLSMQSCAHYDGIDYLHIPMRVGSNKNIRGPARRVHFFIQKHIPAGSVVVCCEHGLHRSAAAVVFHIMHAHQLPIRDALHILRQCHPHADPLQTFAKWLYDEESYMSAAARVDEKHGILP